MCFIVCMCVCVHTSWGRYVLYDITYVEISSSGPEKLVVHIFLSTFQNEVDIFFQGREEIYWIF